MPEEDIFAGAPSAKPAARPVAKPEPKADAKEASDDIFAGAPAVKPAAKSRPEPKREANWGVKPVRRPWITPQTFEKLYDIDEIQKAMARGQTSVLSRTGHETDIEHLSRAYEAAYGHPLSQGGKRENPEADAYTDFGRQPGPAAPRLGGYENTMRHAHRPFAGIQKVIGGAVTAATQAQQGLAGQPVSAQPRSLSKAKRAQLNEAVGTGMLNVVPALFGGPAAAAGFAAASDDPLDMFQSLAVYAGAHVAGKAAGSLKKFFLNAKASKAAASLTKAEVQKVATAAMQKAGMSEPEIAKALEHATGIDARGKPVYRVPAAKTAGDIFEGAPEAAKPKGEPKAAAVEEAQAAPAVESKPEVAPEPQAVPAEQVPETPAQEPQPEVKASAEPVPVAAKEVTEKAATEATAKPLTEAGPISEGASTSNASTAAARETVGAEPHAKPEPQTFQQWVDHAKEQNLDEPEAVKKIAQDVLDGKTRTLSPEQSAGIAARVDRITNEYEKLIAESKALVEEGSNTPRVHEISQRLGEIHGEAAHLSDATKKAGTQQARDFVARRMLVTEDFRLLPVTQRAEAAAGRKLTAKEAEAYSKLTEELKGHEARAAALAEESKGHAERADRLQKMLDENKGRARRSLARGERSTRIKAEKEKTLSDLKAALSKHSKGGGMGSRERGAIQFPDNAPEIARHVKKLVQLSIEEGANTLQEIYDGVRQHVRNLGYEITDAQIRKAFAEGSEAARRPLSQAARLRTMIRLHAEIDKALSGELPGRASSSRAKDEEISGLRKRLADIIKEIRGDRKQGARPTDADKQERALARTLAKALDDLKAVREGQIPTAKKGAAPLTEKAADLKQQVADIRKEIAELKKKAKPTVSEKARIDALEARAKAYDEQVAGQSRPLNSKPRPEETEAVKAARKKLRDAARQVKLQDQVYDLEEQLRTGDFKDKPAAKQRDLSDLDNRIKQLKDIIRNRIEDQRPKTFAEKAGGYVRGSVLSSVPVIAKLAGAAAWRHAVGPLEDLLGYGIERLPAGGGKTLGEIAPAAAGGGGTWKRLRSPLTKEAWKNAVDEIRHHVDAIDAAAGDRVHAGGGISGIPGRMHGAVKTALVKTGEYRAAEAKSLRWAKKLGLDVTDGKVREMIAFRSAQEAQTSILRGENKLTKGFDAFTDRLLAKNTGRPVQDATAKAFGLFLRTAVPVARVGANFVGQAADYTGAGIVRGAVEHGAALSKGTAMSVEEAQSIARAYKRGGAGLIAAYLGLVQPKWFTSSGYYIPGKKDQNPDQLAVGGKEIPHKFTHSPWVDAVNFWATLRGQQAKAGSEKSAGKAVGGLAEKFPGAESLVQAGKDLFDGNVGTAFGRMAGEYVPGILQGPSRAMDLEEGSPTNYILTGQGKVVKRKDDNFVRAALQGTPLRKLLPRKGVPEAKDGQTYREYLRAMPLPGVLSYMAAVKAGENAPFAKDIPGADAAAKARSLARLAKAKARNSAAFAARRRYGPDGRKLTLEERRAAVKKARDLMDQIDALARGRSKAYNKAP